MEILCCFSFFFSYIVAYAARIWPSGVSFEHPVRQRASLEHHFKIKALAISLNSERFCNYG